MILNLAYSGTHKGIALTDKELREMVQTFKKDTTVISPKITISHNGIENQKNLGVVNDIWIDEKGILQGDIEFTDEEFKKDYEKNYYPNRSIGVKRALFDGEEKSYLHHIALLGGDIAPRISGLNLSEEEKKDLTEININFSEKEKKTMTENEIKAMQEKLAKLEEEKNNKIFAEVEKAKELAKVESEKLAKVEEEKKELEEKLRVFSEREHENKKENFKKILAGNFPEKAINDFIEVFDKKVFSEESENAFEKLLKTMIKEKPTGLDFGEERIIEKDEDFEIKM